MKKILTFILLMILIFSPSSFAYADTPLPAWKEVFQALIKDADANGPYPKSEDQLEKDQLQFLTLFGFRSDHLLHSYTLYDIDKDGIPELVLHFGTSTAESFGQLYRFMDGDAQLIKEFAYGGNSLATFPGDNGVLICHARDFAQSVKLWTLTDSEIIESEVLFSETLEVMRSYTEISEIVPGAVRLAEFPADTLLPVLTYESWVDELGVSRVVSDQEALTAVFPEDDVEFFQDVINGERLVLPKLISREYDDYWEKFEPREILYSDMEMALAKQSLNYSLTNNIPVDFSKRSVTYVDLNKDGQLEAMCSFRLWLCADEDLQLFIVLSEQEGAVYAYGLFDVSITGVDATGTLYYFNIDREKPSFTTEYAFRLVFDKNSCFMFYVPFDHYSGKRIDRADAYREALASRGRPARGNTSIEVEERYNMLEAYRALWNYAMGNAGWTFNPRYPELTAELGDALSTCEGLFYSYSGPISGTVIATRKRGRLLPIAVYDYFEERMVCSYILSPDELRAEKPNDALLNAEIYYLQFA